VKFPGTGKEEEFIHPTDHHYEADIELGYLPGEVLTLTI